MERLELESIVAEKINNLMGFNVVELLGEGQSGKVYKCVRADYGIVHESAVKAIIIPENIEVFSDNDRGFLEGMVRRSLVEIEALIKLKPSPNIIAIEDYECDVLPDGRVIILVRMELAKKVILDEILCFSRQKRIEILLDIGKGIMDCEGNGIIHGDIKPSNLFIAENGNYKLGDFGISQIKSDAANVEVFPENRGTPCFCTPELWRNGIRDRSTDIYSIGILGFVLFNDGMPPFLRIEEKDSSEAKERAFKTRINGTKMPFPIHGGKELSRIIRKATEFLSENRYSGSEEFCEEIKRLLETESEFHGIDVDQQDENFESKAIDANAEELECCNMGNYWNGDFVCKLGEIFLISDLVSGGLYSTSKCRKLHLLSKEYFISLKTIENDLYSLNSNGGLIKVEFVKNKIRVQSKISIGENFTNLKVIDKILFGITGKGELNCIVKKQDRKISKNRIEKVKTLLDLGRKCFRPIRHNDLIFHGGVSEDSGLYCTSAISGTSYKLLKTELRTFTVFRNQLISADYNGMIRIYNLFDLEELFYKRNKGEIRNTNKDIMGKKEIKEIESVAGTNIELICCISDKIFMQSISGECYIYERGTLLELNTSAVEPIT